MDERSNTEKYGKAVQENNNLSKHSLWAIETMMPDDSVESPFRTDSGTPYFEIQGPFNTFRFGNDIKEWLGIGDTNTLPKILTMVLNIESELAELKRLIHIELYGVHKEG